MQQSKSTRRSFSVLRDSDWMTLSLSLSSDWLSFQGFYLQYILVRCVLGYVYFLLNVLVDLWCHRLLSVFPFFTVFNFARAWKHKFEVQTDDGEEGRKQELTVFALL